MWWLHLIAVGVCLLTFLIFASMYKKPKRPEKTQIICPRSKRALMDFELIYGRCQGCVWTCLNKCSHLHGPEKLRRVDDMIKECSVNIKEQLNESNRV